MNKQDVRLTHTKLGFHRWVVRTHDVQNNAIHYSVGFKTRKEALATISR